MAEWPNAYAWKAYKAERSSRVRLPPSPHKMQNNKATTQQLATIGLFIVIWGHFENYLNLFLFKNSRDWLRSQMQKKDDKTLFVSSISTQNINIISEPLRKIPIEDKINEVDSKSAPEIRKKLKELERSWGPIEFRNVISHQTMIVSVMGAMHNDKCPGYPKYTKPINTKDSKNKSFQSIRINQKDIEMFDLYTMNDANSFCEEILSFLHYVGYKEKHKINIDKLNIDPI